MGFHYYSDLRSSGCSLHGRAPSSMVGRGMDIHAQGSLGHGVYNHDSHALGIHSPRSGDPSTHDAHSGLEDRNHTPHRVVQSWHVEHPRSPVQCAPGRHGDYQLSPRGHS